jgi:hypothetical protein
VAPPQGFEVEGQENNGSSFYLLPLKLSFVWKRSMVYGKDYASLREPLIFAISYCYPGMPGTTS